MFPSTFDIPKHVWSQQCGVGDCGLVFGVYSASLYYCLRFSSREEFGECEGEVCVLNYALRNEHKDMGNDTQLV